MSMQFCQNRASQIHFDQIFLGAKNRFVMTKLIPFTGLALQSSGKSCGVHMEMYCQLQMLHSRFLHFSAMVWRTVTTHVSPLVE